MPKGYPKHGCEEIMSIAPLESPSRTATEDHFPSSLRHGSARSITSRACNKAQCHVKAKQSTLLKERDYEVAIEPCNRLMTQAIGALRRRQPSTQHTK